MPEETLRWGVISSARIATEKVIPAIRRSATGVVEAIASRTEARARAVADRHGILKAYGTYAALLEDPAIDAVYNPLPNHLHIDWTLAALEAGKHVLCEKPLGMNVADVERLNGVRPDLHVMEAFMVRHHPQWLRARELVRSGRIGELRAVQVFFSFFNRDPGNIRNIPETGGGALMDIGGYGIVSGRFLFDAEPGRVMALIDWDPDFGVDRLASVIADFGEGRNLSFVVSTQLALHQRVTACGTTGRIEILVPFNAPQMETTRILIDDGSQLGGGSSVEERLGPVDQYAEEVDAFARVVFGEEPPVYGREDGMRNMKIIDALYRSAETGNWEPTGL